MTQGLLIVILLALVVTGVGAIALIALVNTRADAGSSRGAGKRTNPEDALGLANKRREFMRRYPKWAGRDFQNDATSPWHTDPDFADRSPR